MEAVYDRTWEDVWARNEKGVLDAVDLNRIGNNLAEAAAGLGDSFTARSYSMESKPTESDYAGILEKLAFLKEKGLTYPETPGLPSLPLNRYDKWNAVEKIIYDLYSICQSNAKRKRYCGETHTGEGIGVL